MLAKVISGGQTGADRAALDAAMKFEIEVGGFCPRGRKAEDGTIPAKYPLIELESSSYPDRTKQNILAADFTLILNWNKLSGGTAKTIDFCRSYMKPYVVRDPAQMNLFGVFGMNFETVLADLLVSEKGIVLNVAGPRESKRPGIYLSSRRYLEELFQYLKQKGYLLGAEDSRTAISR